MHVNPTETERSLLADILKEIHAELLKNKKNNPRRKWRCKGEYEVT